MTSWPIARRSQFDRALPSCQHASKRVCFALLDTDYLLAIVRTSIQPAASVATGRQDATLMCLVNRAGYVVSERGRVTTVARVRALWSPEAL